MLLKQHVPAQWDPEVALTQLGLQKPHVCVCGFDAPPLCVLSKLSSSCSTPLRRPCPLKSTVERVIAQRYFGDGNS